MYSTLINGEVLDWKFKSMAPCKGYFFYVGEIFIGQIFGPSKRRNEWSIVGTKLSMPVTDLKLYPIDGFKSRDGAATALLKLEIHENQEAIKNKIFKGDK